jgi:hypothetical protein
MQMQMPKPRIGTESFSALIRTLAIPRNQGVRFYADMCRSSCERTREAMSVNGDYRWCKRELYEYCSTVCYYLDGYDS